MSIPGWKQAPDGDPQQHPHPEPYPEPSGRLPGGEPSVPAAPASSAGPDAQPPPVAAPSRGEAPAASSGSSAVRRTGSPIIAPGLRPAALTAGLCALLALTAAVGRPALAFAVVLLQAVTAAGWFRLNGMWPARQGIALAFAAGLTADALVLAAGGEHAPEAAMGTLGVWCLLVVLLQLRHRGAADERLYALTVTVSSTLVTVVCTGHLAAWSAGGRRSAGVGDGWWDGAFAVMGAVAVAVAVLLRALPLPSVASVVVAVAGAAGGAAAAGALTGPGPGGGALLGAAVGVCALIGLRVASYDWPSRFVHFTAGVALPLAAAAPAVQLISRLLG